MMKKNDLSPSSPTPTNPDPSPKAAATPATAEDTTADPGTPEDSGGAQQCEARVDATVALPARLGLVKGRAVLPSADLPMMFKTPEQIFNELIPDMRKALLVPGSGWMLSDVRARFDALTALHADLSESIQLQAHPQNSKLIPDAGKAVLIAARTVPGGGAMEVDTDALDKKLNRLNFLLDLRDKQQEFDDILDKNISKAENEINVIVRDGLKPVRSMLPYNVKLQRALLPAVELVRKNAIAGVQTQKDHENVAKKAVEAYQTGQQQESVPPPPSPPGTVVSVTSPGAGGTAVAAPAHAPAQPARVPKPRGSGKRTGPQKTK